MKFTVIRERFQSVLQNAGFFISSRINEISLLRGVYLSINNTTITVKTSNITEYFIGEIGGKIEEEGVVLVDFKTLFEVVRSISEDKIIVEKKGNFLNISSKVGIVKIPILDHRDFPDEPLRDKMQSMDTTLFTFEVLSKVLFSASLDETRPTLTGVCFDFLEEDVNIVTTDGFRMSLLSLTNRTAVLKGTKFIVPAKSLSSVSKIFNKGPNEVLFSSKERVLEFRGEEVRVFTHFIEGEYPPYEKVIPTSQNVRLIIKKDEIINALKTVSLFTKEGSNTVTLNLSNDGLVISSPQSSRGRARFNIPLVEKEGGEVVVAFNYRFLLEFIDNSKESDIVVELLNSFAPGLFKQLKENHFIHIIMPIRSQE